MKSKRVRKNFTLNTMTVKVLKLLARREDTTMSRIVEKAIKLLGNAEVGVVGHPNDRPETWDDAQRLLDSLPSKNSILEEATAARGKK